jgi:predicted ATPase
LEAIRLHPSVTYLVGENGSGKSTLVEALAVAAGFNAEGGTKNFNFATSRTDSDLHQRLTLVRGARRERDGFFLRAESFCNVATEVDALEAVDPGTGMLEAYGGKSLHHQSHGESFLSLVQNRFNKDSLFFLDEPESALSPSRQLVLLAEIHRLVRSGCQFVIATHSPILMSYPDSSMYWLSPEGVEERDWTETEHFQVMKAFMLRPEIVLRNLLSED